VPQVFITAKKFSGSEIKGQRSKVWPLARPVNLQRRRHTFRRCGVEAHLFDFCALYLIHESLTAVETACLLVSGWRG